jgi:hypothetical protein
MNKKTIIQLVIIVVAFGAAGVVLYNGFFNNGNSGPQAGIIGSPFHSASTSVQSILPYGDTPLDIKFKEVLDPNRFQYNQIDYPKLDPKNDVGISPDNLIIPPPVTQQMP